jgi:hypothetical protein
MAAAYTSITLSYLAKARVLGESLRRHAPELRFHLVLSEPPPAWLLDGVGRGDEPFHAVLSVEDLDIPERKAWLFGHDVVEACTGVKGPALVKLLGEPGEDRAIYLDPDIVVFDSLDPILRRLDDCSIVLTPHCADAETELFGIVNNEITSLAHGVYNLGFLGVAGDAEGRRFARWWARRLYHFCHDDIPRGLFTDQRWIDLVPAQFDRVGILRDPQYNVASWNLTQRRLTGSVEEGVCCNGRPLCFYHFSHINTGALDEACRPLLDRNPALPGLLAWYRAECERQGESRWRSSRWHYAAYDDGTPITRAQRLLYRQDAALRQRFPDPFATRGDSYYRWLRTEGPGLEAVERLFGCDAAEVRYAARLARWLAGSRTYRWYARARRLAGSVARRAA